MDNRKQGNTENFRKCPKPAPEMPIDLVHFTVVSIGFFPNWRNFALELSKPTWKFDSR